jgi:hypothetical protein
MLIYGVPNGHSVVYNLVWLREFSAQIAAGELYPRWLLDVNAGAGSPAFFFYGPLPFYIASLGVVFCAACDGSVQLAIGESLMLSLSGLAFYVFARANASRLPATISAVLYMFLPYHLEFNLWHRQAIGEFAAYIWMPLLLLSVQGISRGENKVAALAIFYSLLIFTHLPAALLFSICLLFYAAMLSTSNGWQTVMPRFALGILLGIMLSGIYLVPAMFMQEYITSEYWQSPRFLYDRWLFLDGVAEPNTEFGDRLFLVLGLSTAMFAIFWATAFVGNRTARIRTIFPWLLFVVFAWFLMSPLSIPLWEVVPLLQKVQFPYRIAIVLDLAVAATAVYALHCVCRAPRLPALFGLGCCLILLGYTVYSGRDKVAELLDPYSDPALLAFIDAQVAAGAGPPEYLPIWVKSPPPVIRQFAASQPRLTLGTSGSAANVAVWAPREIQIDVDLARRADLVVRQFYFPGWRASADPSGDTAIDVAPAETSGFIQLSAPPGRYRIRLELAPLWPEILGTVITGVGLLLLILMFWHRGIDDSQTDSGG